MNYIAPASHALIPIYSDRPATAALAPISDSAAGFRDASRKPPSTYVYRGEVIEAVADDRRYRPGSNLQIDPRNRRAIRTYRQVSSTDYPPGQILNRFI